MVYYLVDLSNTVIHHRPTLNLSDLLNLLLQGMDSINRIKSNLLIDFNEDFLRRNEVWLVQCPKNVSTSIN